jgi:hypothetical protein
MSIYYFVLAKRLNIHFAYFNKTMFTNSGALWSTTDQVARTYILLYVVYSTRLSPQKSSKSNSKHCKTYNIVLWHLWWQRILKNRYISCNSTIGLSLANWKQKNEHSKTWSQESKDCKVKSNFMFSYYVQIISTCQSAQTQNYLCILLPENKEYVDAFFIFCCIDY